MSRVYPFLGVFVSMALAAFPAAGQDAARPSKGVPDAVIVSVDNDLFGSGLDRHYTQGMRAAWVLAPGLVRDHVLDAATLVPWINTSDTFTFVVSVGQNMYTPEDISRPDPDPTDRPYAGWLYVSLGAIAEDSENNLMHTVALDLGMVGPASLAGTTQRWWHSLIDTTTPRGWDHQLSNEPGVVLTYETRLREPLTTEMDVAGSGIDADFTPKAGIALGNVFDYVAIGADMRFGKNLGLDFGPPLIRPSLPGSGLVRRKGEWGWYVFGGFEGRAVGHNIFLDGNTFADSPSVDKRPFVGDMQAGLAITMDNVRISFTQVLRTQEFHGQHGIDHYGSFSFTYLF